MESHPCRIVLIGDDDIAAASIAAVLREAGHACRRCDRGEVAMRGLGEEPVDVMLVERKRSDISAARLIGGVRARYGFAVSVIALTPADDADGMIAALDDGADDCLAWPVPPRLLLARINAAVRRMVPQAARVEAEVGHLRFQPDGNRVRVDGADVALTAKEYALGLLLCRNLGEPLDREDLLDRIWGGDVAPLTRTLDVHVSRLRTKLELWPVRGFRLTALYGRGYRLEYDQAPDMRRTVVRRRSACPPRAAAPAGLPAAG